MNSFKNDIKNLFDIDAYNFELKDEYIAKYPLKKRDEAKLLIVNSKGDIIKDTKFYDIINFFNENDLLILNNSKVIKSRIYGYREKDKRPVEILLLDPLIIDSINKTYSFDSEKYKKFYALIKNRKKFKINDILIFEGTKNIEDSEKIKCQIIEYIEDKTIIEFEDFIDIKKLENIGTMPIPPYFKRKAEEIDNEYYQTVYSKKYGSLASPTAGLHFTDKLLKEVTDKIFSVEYVTLHVGWGTFSPIRTKNIKEHKMHYEYYEINEKLINAINTVKEKNGRVIVCGTTTLRALEGNFHSSGKLTAGNFKTNIFIYPGFKFNVVDSLITNFHTPKSSLLVLVSAFAGYENIKKYYNYALSKNFRFFSYGDAMFIVEHV